MYFHMYQDAQNLWRWHLKASNGRTIADSGESYYNKADCEAGIYLVMDTNRNTPIR